MTVTGEILPDEPGFLLEFDEVYDTDADDLWEALTTPERLARWMATYRGEFRLGGHWQAMQRDGGVYCDGEITSCERPVGFTTTWTVVGEQTTLVTVQLEPEGARTRLRLRHEHVTHLEYGAGWHAHLEGLTRHVADPAAGRDRDEWLRRIDELEPSYLERFAALTPKAP